MGAKQIWRRIFYFIFFKSDLVKILTVKLWCENDFSADYKLPSGWSRPWYSRHSPAALNLLTALMLPKSFGSVGEVRALDMSGVSVFALR